MKYLKCNFTSVLESKDKVNPSQKRELLVEFKFYGLVNNWP